MLYLEAKFQLFLLLPQKTHHSSHHYINMKALLNKIIYHWTGCDTTHMPKYYSIFSTSFFHADSNLETILDSAKLKLFQGKIFIAFSLQLLSAKLVIHLEISFFNSLFNKHIAIRITRTYSMTITSSYEPHKVEDLPLLPMSQ